MSTAQTSSDPTRPHTVGIVGLGPKGLHCLERLLAGFAAAPLQRGLDIHVFNRTATFGASLVYDPAQPDYILFNNSVSVIDLWGAEDPPTVGGRGPDFIAWWGERLQRTVRSDEYPPRAVIGEYLMDGFERMRARLPDGVRLFPHHGEVDDIVPASPGYRVNFITAEGSREHIACDKVMLATGHASRMPDELTRSLADFARRHKNAAFIPYVYPVVETLHTVPAGDDVAMLGIGLTFIDAVLALTEGRGGRFVRAQNGALLYERSGKEPRRIFPFSRSGLPMSPKSVDVAQQDRPLVFLTETALAAVRRHTGCDKLDLERDLRPLVEDEIALNYYRVAMPPGEWRDRLEAAAGDRAAMRPVIDAFHHATPESERFDYARVLDPAAEQIFANGAEYSEFIARLMEQEIADSRKGRAHSAVKSAMEIWAECRKALGSIAAFGGLAPLSHRQLNEEWYPKFKRVAFGPPVINMEKLLALTRAGLVHFSVARSPRVTLDDASGEFVLECSGQINAVARVDVLVDARSPYGNVLRDVPRLYRSLQQRGLIRPWSNNDGDSSYTPGAVDMAPGVQHVVDAHGICNPDISVIGIPTEGNLTGNLTIGRDDASALWAAETVDGLRRCEMLL